MWYSSLPEAMVGRSLMRSMQSDTDKQTQLSKLLDIALGFHKQGNLPEAERVYREILRSDFDYADAWHLLGLLVFHSGYFQTAIELIGEAIALDPEEPYYRNSLGSVYTRQSDLPAAVDCYDTALFLKPDYVEAHCNRATALRDQGKLEQASEAYRTALRLAPDDIEVLNDLAGVLRRQGDLPAAIAHYRKAVELDSNRAGLYVNLGLALEEQGERDAAVDCYRRALALQPTRRRARERLVQLTGKPVDDAESLSRLKALLGDENLSEGDKEHVHRGLAEAYEGQDSFGEAFEHYAIANSLKKRREKIVFDLDSFVNEANSIIAVFTREFFEARPGFGSASELPAFIVGAPRSGKSLLCSLMSHHREIVSVEQAAYFSEFKYGLSEHLKSSKTYPGCLAELDNELARNVAQGYVDHLQGYAGEVSRVINTACDIFDMGLIALLFPKARIIHCRRNALDLCLSIYFESFSAALRYAYDLETIALCNTEYERVMRHWHEILSGRILTIDYEQLVVEPRDSLRKALEWYDVAWSEQLASDEDNEHSAIATLHHRYVNRWRDYERFIDDLRAILERPVT
ncbi:MAG: tetratricopeptide repeat protein [Acidiferrobacterales bacterium]